MTPDKSYDCNGSLVLPAFNMRSPKVWFIQCESIFALKNTDSLSKYHHIISVLPADIAESVVDVIENPKEGMEPYTELKEAVLLRHMSDKGEKSKVAEEVEPREEEVMILSDTTERVSSPRERKVRKIAYNNTRRNMRKVLKFEEEEEEEVDDDEEDTVFGNSSKATNSKRRDSNVQSGAFHCSYCDGRFRSEYMLTRHMKISHSNQKTYDCNICNKSYQSRRSLNYHVSRVHEKQRPFACDVCHKRFRAKQNLQQHMARFHMGEEMSQEWEDTSGESSPGSGSSDQSSSNNDESSNNDNAANNDDNNDDMNNDEADDDNNNNNETDDNNNDINNNDINNNEINNNEFVNIGEFNFMEKSVKVECDVEILSY